MKLNLINYFTPIYFGDLPKTLSESVLEVADNYFYLNGKKAQVISRNYEENILSVDLVEGKQSFLKSCFKVISYFTLILPIILLIVKTVMRSFNSCVIEEKKSSLIAKNVNKNNSSLTGNSPLVSFIKENSSILINKDNQENDSITKELTLAKTIEVKATKENDLSVANEPDFTSPQLSSAPSQLTPDVKAELLWNEGKFIKALFEVDSFGNGDLVKSFMKKMKDENKLFQKNAQGKYLIGDRESAAKTIQQIKLTEIRNTFFVLLAENYYSEGDAGKAIKTLVMVSKELRDNLLKKILKECEPLAKCVKFFPERASRKSVSKSKNEIIYLNILQNITNIYRHCRLSLNKDHIFSAIGKPNSCQPVDYREMGLTVIDSNICDNAPSETDPLNEREIENVSANLYVLINTIESLEFIHLRQFEKFKVAFKKIRNSEGDYEFLKKNLLKEKLLKQSILVNS